MTIQTVTQYFLQFGGVVIFIVTLIEYLGVPGFPAGFILPLAGVWSARGEISFLLIMVLAMSAGLIGSSALYLLGRLGSDLVIEKYLKKFPKQEEFLNKHMGLLERKGFIGVFVIRLIPFLRNLISLPAGLLKMDFTQYTISSGLGIFVWNFVLTGAGYLLGDSILKFFDSVRLRAFQG